MPYELGVLNDALYRSDFTLWRSKPGDSAEGTFATFRMLKSKDGRPFRVAVLDTEEGFLGVSMTTVAKSKFEELGIVPGDKVSVARLEDKPGRHGHAYHDYEISREPFFRLPEGVPYPVADFVDVVWTLRLGDVSVWFDVYCSPACYSGCWFEDCYIVKTFNSFMLCSAAPLPKGFAEDILCMERRLANFTIAPHFDAKCRPAWEEAMWGSPQGLTFHSVSFALGNLKSKPTIGTGIKEALQKLDDLPSDSATLFPSGYEVWLSGGYFNNRSEWGPSAEEGGEHANQPARRREQSGSGDIDLLEEA